MINNYQKLLKYINNGDELNDVCTRLEIKETELLGLIEYLKLEGYNIDIYQEEGKIKISKKAVRKNDTSIKNNLNDLEETKLCIVSDTHIGHKAQQLTLLNLVYTEAYRRGCKTILHCGDLVDGDYRNKRPTHPYQVFLQGFDEQCEYVIENYPKVKNIKTHFIQGSHDETHFLNGGATIGKWISRERDDMIFLGQDSYTYKVGAKKKTDILMFHPGGGSAKALSYNPQEKINKMEPGSKPNILLEGHYHKNYYMFYRNVHVILVPCFMDKSGFMIRNSLTNIVGAYFLNIYTNKKGDVEYITPEQYLFNEKEINPNDYKKCKKLVIN